MGALGHNTSAVYLSLIDGKVVRRFKEPTQHSKPRTITKGVNTGKVIHEEHYDYIQGWIKDIKVKLPNDPSYGKTWIVTFLDDDGSEYVLQMDYSSGYSSAFLKTLPNIDFSNKVKISPTMKLENEKKKVGMFINQNGKWLKSFFTKDHPNGLPQMKKLIVKGKEVWDDTEMMAFLEKMVNNDVLPLLTKSAGERTSSTAHIDQSMQNDIDNLQEEHMDDRGAPPPTENDDLPF
ncbi:MAG TPA: hypothetical protein VGD31_03205 [Sphingobacteriaceae bacterium]